MWSVKASPQAVIPPSTELGNGRKHAVFLIFSILAAWVAIIGWSPLLPTMRILKFGTPFLDSYAILAAVDAVRAGADPHEANPLDPLMRGHVYSDWWLALKYLGLTRGCNWWLGIVWVSTFGIAAVSTARPRDWREVSWLFFILISPSVMLAITRANNDLVIFVLLAGCSLAAVPGRWWKSGVAVACLGLATGLKYFPAAGVLSFLWIRPVRRMPMVLLAALGAVALVMRMVAGEIDRARFFVPSGLHTVGAALLWRDFGWTDAQVALPSLAVVVVGALVLAASRFTVGLASRGNAVERMRAALGSVVLLACFFSGVSYAYRWIFVVWPAIWLWRQAREASVDPRHRWTAVLACGFVFACVWLDGLLCISANLLFPPMTVATMEHLLVIWRHWTQPLPWLLMMLLGGWLTEAAWATAREWWSLRHEV